MRSVLLFPIFALLLAGCAPLGIAVGAGATVGVAASQERGFRQAASDTAIEIGISERLLRKDLNLFSRVGVTVVDARVLLTGAVVSEDAKIEAERLAWQSAGLRGVLNEIQVAESTDAIDYARDARITAELRTEILRDREISDINYSIETVNGIVYLMGVAQDRAEIQRVIDYARAISGVRRVVSHVALKDDLHGRPA